MSGERLDELIAAYERVCAAVDRAAEVELAGQSLAVLETCTLGYYCTEHAATHAAVHFYADVSERLRIETARRDREKAAEAPVEPEAVMLW